MRRKVRDFDLERFAPNALEEGFTRGSYKLPRKVRRFLHRPLQAYANRPRMLQAVATLALIIGQYHTGERNFLLRGCGIGGEGAGFFLSRAGLCGDSGWKGLTHALVREATAFLIRIGFIERITPAGDLVEVRCPKNSKSGLTYFRTGLKAKKDSLGRIRSPLTMYRLGAATRSLFAKTLRPGWDPERVAGKEPLWITSTKTLSDTAVTSVEGVHSGCAPYDRAGHDPGDPRFDYARPDPDRDPFKRPRFSNAQRAEAEATLEALKRGAGKLSPLSSAALRIFNKPARR